jgi:hypothetical protein
MVRNHWFEITNAQGKQKIEIFVLTPFFPVEDEAPFRVGLPVT